jgi:N-acetylornithine carbamoyltransferase
MRHYLAIEDFSIDELWEMVNRADEFKRDRFSCADCLKNKTLITLFMNPSTRTRTSFDLAITQLGGHVVTIEPGKSSWGVEIREGAMMDGDAEEHLKDAANVLSRYGDFIALRAFPAFKNWAEERKDLILTNLAKWSKVPVINMETITHPAQALAMLQTIRGALGEPRRRKA